MTDQKWDQRASDIYCFADDLGQALGAIEDEGWSNGFNLADRTPDVIQTEIELRWAEAIQLVGLSLTRVFEETDNQMAGTFPIGAKRAFQKELGIDPDDSQSPWPPVDEDSLFETIVDEHDGRRDLRAVVKLPGGFVVEVAIEDTTGTPEIVLYAGTPEDPDSPIPDTLVGRWSVAELADTGEEA